MIFETTVTNGQLIFETNVKRWLCDITYLSKTLDPIIIYGEYLQNISTGFDYQLDFALTE